MNKKKLKTTSNPKTRNKQPKKNSLAELMSKNWFFPLFFMLVTFIAYANSFGVPFQFDDSNQISYREWYHSFNFYKDLGNWFKINERPFSFFTLTFNYVLHGEKVFGYHLVNFFIHFLSALFLFYWLRLLPLLKNDESKKQWFPLIVTLFFLVHPAQTQSVTYIIQRMTSLAGLFLILSVYFYTKGRLNHIANGTLRSGIYCYLLSLFSGVLAILSKQNAVVFPVILLLVEFFFIRNREGKVFRTWLITALSAIVFIVIAVIISVGLPAETTAITRLQYLATQMTVIPRYFQLMLFPVGLSIDHGVKIVDGFSNLWSLLGALFLLALLVYAIFMMKKEPLFSFGIFWIFITLSVESSILPITDPMFDQRMYLPIAGFGIAVWAMLDRFLFRKKVNLLKPVAVTVILLFSVMTIARNNVWNDRITIWQDVTEKYPDHLRGWMALGKMYMNNEQPDIPKSIACFEKARTIDPNQEENLMDLGFAYMSVRQEEKALACYEQLLNSENTLYKEQALKVMSAYNSTKGNIDDSAQYLRNILKMKPADEDTWKSLFAIYFDKKEFTKAKDIAQEWVSKYPANSNASFYLGKSFFHLKDKDTAGNYLLAALKLNPENADAMMLYANICVNRFEYDRAIKLLEKAYSINKNSKIPENIELIRQLKTKAPKPSK